MSDKKKDKKPKAKDAGADKTAVKPVSDDEAAKVDVPEKPTETPDEKDAAIEDASAHSGHAAQEKTEVHSAHEEHEEHGPSLSARVLRGLFLIAVGCVIALWGAPKLAPMLPKGLAPVAEFLMPGQSEAKAEIDALRADLEVRLGNLESRPADGVSQDAIDASIAAYAAKLSPTLEALKDQIGATDSQDIEARLAQIETRMEGVTAELATVGERLSLQITENGAALSEEAAAKLAGYQAVIDGLKAQVDDLAAKNGTLSQKIDEVAAASTRRIREAEDEASAKVASTATKKLITDIASALDSGSSFQSALDGLAKIAAIEPPAELSEIAPTGTASWSTLRGQFSEVAHAALRADTQASAGDGIAGKFGAFLKTQVGTRSLERREGDSTDAILSRVEDELIRGNLVAALSESDALAEPPKTEMSEWLSALTRLASAQTALAQLSNTLSAVN